MPNARVARLARYWRASFDWRAFEARLNRYPQFVTEIDGATIHFLHIRSSRKDATPLIDPAEFEGLSEEDQAALEVLQWFYDNKFSFNVVHSQQPQTLSFALTDSPVGLLAWNAQLFPESIDDEFVIANVAIYWLTGTAGSAIRFYYEDAHAADRPSGPTTTPTALAMFAGDFQSIRRFANRDHRNIVSWHSYGSLGAAGQPDDTAGHYAAHEAAGVLVADIREFFAGQADAGQADAGQADAGQAEARQAEAGRTEVGQAPG